MCISRYLQNAVCLTITHYHLRGLRVQNVIKVRNITELLKHTFSRENYQSLSLHLVMEDCHWLGYVVIHITKEQYLILSKKKS